MLSLVSADPVDDLLAQLRVAVPQVFSERGIDFDRLRAVLDPRVDPGAERYGLGWAGKADAFRTVRAPSAGTLLPLPEESVNWDGAGNLIIEGDNLEVLKLLQKPYHGKIKMIYTDPPYHTGNEFPHPDHCREGLEEDISCSGQANEAGVKQSAGSGESTRFHSKWLSMMYPRLFLARSLLREDGVIFVSIDDNEVHNLRLLMNEVFGEENFLACFVRKRRMPTVMRDAEVSSDHEYVVAFTRSIEAVELIGRAVQQSDYPFKDSLSRYSSTDLTAGMTQDMRPNQYYAITNPKTNALHWPSAQRVWRFERKTMEKEIAKNNIIWPEDLPRAGMSRPRYKTRYSTAKTAPISTWIDGRDDAINDWDVKNPAAGMNQAGTKESASLPGNQILEYPKPASLIKSLISISTRAKENHLVLDFFAGSGTAAHAVLELNAEDAGNRKFILVQLPEKLNSSNYATIASITRERVRRVLAKLGKDNDGKSGVDGKAKHDLGFRAFKLSSSNFKVGSAGQTPDTPDKLAEQLKRDAGNVERTRGEQDVLYELILKSGLPLSSNVKQIQIEGALIWSVDDNKLLIDLNKSVTRIVLQGMITHHPRQMLCLDAAFGGNDALKTDILLEAKSHDVVFRTI